MRPRLQVTSEQRGKSARLVCALQRSGTANRSVKGETAKFMQNKTDNKTATGVPQTPTTLAMHLAGCIGISLFKQGDISGVYPTEAIAKLIDKELVKFGI